MLYRLFALTTFLLLSGCASFPDAVQLPPDIPTVSYDQVAMDPDKSKGSLAQWGGVVAEVQNLPEKTLLEVVYYPLRGYGRPIIGKESIGRFRVYVDGFLDPMVYQKGRSVTFSGAIIGAEEGVVGEHNYIFPTMKAKGYYLWEDIDRIDVTTISVWPYPYYGGWYGSYRNWYGWPNYRHHVVTRRHDHYRYPVHEHKNSKSNNSGSSSGNSGSSSSKSSNKDPRPALKKAASGGKNIP